MNRMVAFLVAAAFVSVSNADQIRLSKRTINTNQKMGIGAFESQNSKEWIVQFKNNVSENEKSYLRGLGLEVVSYIPDNAYLVRGDFQQVKAVQQSNYVEALIALTASDKVSKEFTAFSVFNQAQNEVMTVKVYKSEDMKKVLSDLQAMNQVKVFSAQNNIVVLRAPREIAYVLAGKSEIEHVEPYLEVKPLHMAFGTSQQDVNVHAAGDYTDLTGFETGTKVMNFDALWAQGFTGKGQTASMADTGLDNGNLATISGEFKGAVKSGYAFGLFAKTWEDPMGHGTHVAGSILGRGTASGGKLRGGAFEAMFVAEGMWSPMLNNLSVPNKLDDMFAKAFNDGARVHSNSWGAARSFGAYDTMAAAVDTYMFNNPEMLILFAAGNSGVDMNKDGRIDANSIGTPGTAKNVLTVGASENLLDQGGIQVPISKLRSSPETWSAEPIWSSRLSDNINGLAMFSSRGPTTDGRIKPEIVAPGTNILSAKAHTPTAELLWGAYNDEYVYSGGTSMSTPLVAGAATVLRQYLVEKLKFEKPSAALLKASLMHTAVDMFPGQYGEVGVSRGQELATRRPNMDEGYGRVDVSGFLNLEKAKIVDETAGVATGEEKSVEVKSNGGKLLVNLVYTDAPGSTNAAATLVNDIDVYVTLPNGQVISPKDRINNNEIVELANVPAGTIKVSVKGERVAQGKNGKQPYALVISY